MLLAVICDCTGRFASDLPETTFLVFPRGGSNVVQLSCYSLEKNCELYTYKNKTNHRVQNYIEIDRNSIECLESVSVGLEQHWCELCETLSQMSLNWYECLKTIASQLETYAKSA